MELTLTTAEREFLMEILEQHHHELLREISRVRHLEFKDVLRAKERLLESVAGKLKMNQPGEPLQRSA